MKFVSRLLGAQTTCKVYFRDTCALFYVPLTKREVVSSLLSHPVTVN